MSKKRKRNQNKVFKNTDSFMNDFLFETPLINEFSNATGFNKQYTQSQVAGISDVPKFKNPSGFLFYMDKLDSMLVGEEERYNGMSESQDINLVSKQ